MALEPASKAAGVEDVVAGQLLATSGHLFTTDGTEIGLLEFFFCGIRTAEEREQERARRREREGGGRGRESERERERERECKRG